MPRSLKKGPFVDDHLLKKVDALNAAGEKQGHQDLVASLARSSPTWSATPSPCTTAASTCPCTSPSRWSATSSASSRPPAPSGTTPAKRRTRRGGADDRSEVERSQHERPASAAAPRPAPSTSACRPTRPARCSTSSAACHVKRCRRDPAVQPTASVADDIRKVLASAVANAAAQRRAGSRRAVRLGLLRRRGPDAQALAPRARGRGNRIRKRTCHITHRDRPPRRRPPRSRPGPRGQAHRRRPSPSGRRRHQRQPPGPRRAQPPAAAAAAGAVGDAQDRSDHESRPRRDRRSTTRHDCPTVRTAARRQRSAGGLRDQGQRRLDAVPPAGHAVLRPTVAEIWFDTAETPKPPASSCRRANETTTEADAADDDERSRSNGSEDQPVRVPSRHHHRLEVAAGSPSATTRTTSSRTGRSATT